MIKNNNDYKWLFSHQCYYEFAKELSRLFVREWKETLYTQILEKSKKWMGRVQRQ